MQKTGKVLVTGASGFVGRFLCRGLKEKGYQVYKTDSRNCDLRRPGSLDQFDSVRFDWIVHLAAWTQAGDFCLRHQGQQWLINQKINTHVLDWWKGKQGQARLMAMGTSCSYDPDLPLEEKYYLSGKPIDSLLTYALTKRMLYAGLLALHQQYGLEYLYFVPSTFYGPGYHLDGRQMHFIFDLIRKILRGKYYSEPVVLWGDGEQKRELVNIYDFVKAALHFMQTEKNRIVNIGAGKEYSIREFAFKICEMTGFDFNRIKFDLSRYVGARSKILKIEKLKKLMPFYRPISLDKGLRETIDWFVENREKLLLPNAEKTAF